MSVILLTVINCASWSFPHALGGNPATLSEWSTNPDLVGGKLDTRQQHSGMTVAVTVTLTKAQIVPVLSICAMGQKVNSFNATRVRQGC